MIRINGFPLYRLSWALSRITEVLLRPRSRDREILTKLSEAKLDLQFASGRSALPNGDRSQLPTNSQALINAIFDKTQLIVASGTITQAQKGELVAAIGQFNTVLAVDLAVFDVYLITPKLALSTPTVMADASSIFPPEIRDALSERIKYETQQAANCLLYDAPSAVGFHVLRAVEIVVLDYFNLSNWTGPKPRTWSDYSRDLKKLNVHPKIRGMIGRLADLHRNELMHAEAVLTVAEAAMLFAMMQEVLPIMIADVAKRKGEHIANFKILDDPRWQ